MPFPLLPVLIGGGALAAFLLTRKDDGAKGQTVNVLPGTPGMATANLDANLPPQVAQAVLVALRDESDPQKLHAFASALLGEGFPIAAGQLETKANALSLFGPSVPGNVPQAPQSFPPAPNQPPVFIPPQPPVFIPSAPSTPGVLTLPEVVITPGMPDFPMPSIPGMPGLGGLTTTGFDPGNPGSLPALPTSAGWVTDAHKALQTSLARFFASYGVKYPSGNTLDSSRGLLTPMGTLVFSPSDVDGSWGPKSQLALWAFQTWSNATRGTNLTRDGIPGPASQSALTAIGL